MYIKARKRKKRIGGAKSDSRENQDFERKKEYYAGRIGKEARCDPFRSQCLGNGYFNTVHKVRSGAFAILRGFSGLHSGSFPYVVRIGRGIVGQTDSIIDRGDRVLQGEKQSKPKKLSCQISSELRGGPERQGKALAISDIASAFDTAGAMCWYRCRVSAVYILHINAAYINIVKKKWFNLVFSSKAVVHIDTTLSWCDVYFVGF